MREYSSFLLLQDMLDYLPNTVPDLYNFGQTITHPAVTVREADCRTTVGRIVAIDYTLEGYIELATNTILVKSRLDTLLAAGIYTVAIRDLHSCITANGVCQQDYAGTYLDQIVPAIGTTIKLLPDFNYQTDVFRGNGSTVSFTMTQTPPAYYKVLVFINGARVTSGYTIVGNTFTPAATLAPNIDACLKYYKLTTQPYIGYLAQTYAGSLLGMKALPTLDLHLRSSLAQQLITEAEVQIAKQTLTRNYPLINTDYVDYIDTIKDRLEKSLYITLLYAIYSNVTT